MKNITLAFILAALLSAAPARVSALATGAPPPDFTVTDMTGAEVTLSKLKGSVVLLDFWATWCPPCRDEVPRLISIQERFGSRKFVLISVSLDRDPQAARRFVAEKRMEWVHVVDSQAARELAEKYGVRYIPSTFVIDRQGKLAAAQLRGDALAEKIAALLR